MSNKTAVLLKQHLNARIFRSYFSYFEEHYPLLDIGKVCREAGLDPSVFDDDNAWVSCSFSCKFMKLVAAEVKDPQFSYKAGAFGVSKAGLGAALYNLGKNVFDLDYVMRNSWRLSSYLTKVTQLKIVQTDRQFLKARLTILKDNLDEVELAALQETLPDIIQNTLGYYAALPRLKGLPDAKVDLLQVGEDFEISIRYPRESFRRFEVIKALAVTLSGGLSVELMSDSIPWSLSAALALAGAYGVRFVYQMVQNMRSTANDLEENFDLVNRQYKVLQSTQEELDRKYSEAKALNAISNHVVSTMDEDTILKNVCKDISQILSYDRVLIFLRDPEEKKMRYTAGFIAEGPIPPNMYDLSFEINIQSDDETKISNVYRRKKPILIKDVRAHLSSLNEESRLALAASGSRSFVAVPICTDDTTYGVMLADNYSSPRRLATQDLDVLATASKQVATVLGKVRAQRGLAAAYEEIESLATSYSRFVPFKMIELLGFKSVTEVHMQAGREYEMAIVFSDIRGFTSMSEEMNPGDAVSFLNSYFSSLAPTFEEHGGIIDKFLGDGIMALFLEADSAIVASVEFQRKLALYNQIHRTGLKRAFVSAGIGIHFGKVLLGAVGYENRMSISVTSDSVNLASRIDGLNKVFGVDMLCSSDLAVKLPNHDTVRFIGKIKVQGRQAFTEIFEIIGHFDRNGIRDRKAAEMHLRKIVEHLDAQDFESARRLWSLCNEQWPQDPVVKYYGNQIAEKSGEKKKAA